MLEEKMESVDVDAPMKKWDDTDQCQLFHKALQWLDFKGDKIEGLCFKIVQHIVQKGIKKFGVAMKEIHDLDAKKDDFGEVDHDKLYQEMKYKALLLLMLMIIKRNGQIKPRGFANGSCKRVCTEKHERTSPAPELFSVKHACGVAAK